MYINIFMLLRSVLRQLLLFGWAESAFKFPCL